MYCFWLQAVYYFVAFWMQPHVDVFDFFKMIWKWDLKSDTLPKTNTCPNPIFTTYAECVGGSEERVRNVGVVEKASRSSLKSNSNILSHFNSFVFFFFWLKSHFNSFTSPNQVKIWNSTYTQLYFSLRHFKFLFLLKVAEEEGHPSSVY